MTKIPDKVANIRLIDEVNAIVSGLRIGDIGTLFDDYGLFAKGHFFDPRFQLGRWDGKIRFFKKGGKTFIQLLPEIAEKLKQAGYKIKLKDERKPFNLSIDEIDKDYFKDHGWTLGEHQVLAINSILKTNNGIIRVGTGGGKTLITAVLCHLYLARGIRFIVIVPNKDLIKQTKEEISQFGFSVGAYYADEKNVDADIVVSTWQSLIRNKKLITTFDGVIVDECHGANTATQLASILGDEGRDIPVRIGLTGTLPDYETDLLTVLCHIGPVVATVKARELIDKGWLAELNMLMVQLNEDFTEEWEEYKKNFPEEAKNLTYRLFKNNKLFPTYDAESKYHKSNKEKLKIIASMVKATMERVGNCFVLVNTVDFGKKLAKEIGDNAIFVNSKIKDRDPIYSQFKSENNICAVATFRLASTGLNIPRIFGMFLIDGGKSSIQIVQSIGRSLRRADDKDTAILIDLYSDTKFSKRHSIKRKKIYKNENHEFKILKVSYDDDIVEGVFKELKKFKTKKIEDSVLE